MKKYIFCFLLLFVAVSGHALTKVKGVNIDNRYLVLDLRSINPGAASDTSINVSGFHFAGDGGGGLFVWSPTSTGTDDSGTIIKPTSATAGRWIRQYSGHKNILWFGAIIGSSTVNIASNKLAFENALYITTLGPGNSKPSHVYVPNGVYTLGSSSFSIGNYKRIEGESSSSFISPNFASDSTVLTTDYAAATDRLFTVGSRCVFENLVLYGNGSYGSAFYSEGAGMTFGTFRNLVISRFTYGMGSNVAVSNAFSNTLTKVSFFSNSYGIRFGSGANNLIINSCNFDRNNIGVALNDSYNISFFGCDFSGQTTDAYTFYVYNCQPLVVDSCYFENYKRSIFINCPIVTVANSSFIAHDDSTLFYSGFDTNVGSWTRLFTKITGNSFFNPSAGTTTTPLVWGNAGSIATVTLQLFLDSSNIFRNDVPGATYTFTYSLINP